MKKNSNLSVKLLTALLVLSLVFTTGGIKALAEEGIETTEQQLTVLSDAETTTPAAITVTEETVTGPAIVVEEKDTWTIIYRFETEYESGNYDQKSLEIQVDAGKTPIYNTDFTLKMSNLNDDTTTYKDEDYVLQTVDGRDYNMEEKERVIIATFNSLKYYLTFSVATKLGATTNTTNSAILAYRDKSNALWDGKNVKDYYQISDKENAGKTAGSNADKNKRFIIEVNTSVVYNFMKTVLNSTTEIKNLNETKNNSTDPDLGYDEIKAYDTTERTTSGNKDLVESVLRQIISKTNEDGTSVNAFDDAKNATVKYVSTNEDFQKYFSDAFEGGVDFSKAYGTSWYIDWYVMKTQKNGIHVDGMFVKILDTWRVDYEVIKLSGESDYFKNDDTFENVAPDTIPTFNKNIKTVATLAADYGKKYSPYFRLVKDGDKDYRIDTTEKAFIITYKEYSEPYNPPTTGTPTPTPTDVPGDPTPTPTDVPGDPTPTPTDVPGDPTPTPTDVPSDPTPTPDEVVDVNPVETPESAPEEEEIPVDPVETPQGAPEEDIPVDIPEVPQGLPQTGTTDTMVFYGFGLACIGVGAVAVRKGLRKEEDAE